MSAYFETIDLEKVVGDKARAAIPEMTRFERMHFEHSPYVDVFAIFGPVRGDKVSYSLVTFSAHERAKEDEAYINLKIAAARTRLINLLEDALPRSETAAA